MRIRALITRIIHQFLGDKRSLALMLFAPILILSLMYGVLDERTFNQVGPVLIGYFAFFFVFLLAGVSFLRERTGGTLERLMASPIKRFEIVIGYVLGFAFFASIQAIVIATYSVYILDMQMQGSLFPVLVVTLMLSLTALTLGILISTFSNNELQIIQFIPLVIVPQMFFSGVFEIEAMAEPLQWISKFMPMRYGADGLKEIMLNGGGFSDVYLEILLLSGISLVFMFMNFLVLKKHRN
jgi:ABC-2 type transport system permease protein